MSYGLVRAASESPNPIIPALPDLLWGTIAFVILLVFFARYLLPRLNALLDARSAAIEGGIKRAEEAQESAQAALDRYNAQLAEARAEAGQIREQAREDGKRILAEFREQAQLEAARIAAQAQAQIEVERAAAVQSLRAEVGTLAVQLASGVVGEHLEHDDHAAAVVDRFLAELDLDSAGA